MIARNNHRGTDRILKGEESIRHFIDRVSFVRARCPLLWASSKRNRRVELRYWSPVELSTGDPEFVTKLQRLKRG